MANPNARFVITAQDQATRVLKGIRGEVSNLSSIFGRMNVAIGGLVAGGSLSLLVRDSLQAADEVQKLSQRLGASTEALSQYRYVADLTGVSFNQLTVGWQRMTRRIAEAAVGTGEAQNALRELGLQAQALNALAPEQQFEILADAMLNVESSSERVRLAMKLFDSEGVALLQTMQGGSEAIRAMRAEADQLGLSLDQNAADAAARANDAFTRLSAAGKALGISMMNTLAPVIADVVTWLQTRLPEAAQFAIDAFFTLQRLVAKSSSIITEQLSGIAGGLADAADFIGADRLSRALQKTADDYASVADTWQRVAVRVGEAAKAENVRSAALQTGITFNQLYNAELAKSAKLNDASATARSSAAKATSDARKAIESYLEQLQKEADTLGATNVELGRYELLKLGATQADIARAAALQGQIDAFEQARQAEQQLADQRQRAMELIKDLDSGSAIRDQIIEVQRLRDTFPELSDSLAEVEFELQDKWDRIGDTVTDAADQARDAWQDLGPTFASAFEDAIVSGNGLRDVMKGLEQDLIRIVTRNLVTEPLGNMISGLFSGGQSGGGIFNFIGGLFGGARASGGPVWPGRAYLVGEQGPELMVPAAAGNVVPNHQLGSSGMVNNFHFTLPGDTVDYRRAGAQVAREAARQLRFAGGSV